MNLKAYRQNICRSDLARNARLLVALIALANIVVSCTQQPDVTTPQLYQPEDVFEAQWSFLMERLDEWDAPTTPAQVDAFIAGAEAAWAEEARQRYPGHEREVDDGAGRQLPHALTRTLLLAEHLQHDRLRYFLGEDSDGDEVTDAGALRQYLSGACHAILPVCLPILEDSQIYVN